MKIESHWLVEAQKRRSPNHGGAIMPRYLVMHYTAGRRMAETTEWLCEEKSKASAHVIIGRDGSICQLLPFNVKAWHAGISQWQGLIGLNDYSIGIELENFGKLYRVGNHYRTWFQAVVAAEETIELRHRLDSESGFWHVYSEAQIAAATALASLLVGEYALKDILGHDDVAPERKRDPGPAFPMESFKAMVLGRSDDVVQYYNVNSDFLNIRSGPGSQHPAICPPLKKGTRLALLEREEDWSKVLVEDEGQLAGWVSNWHIRPA